MDIYDITILGGGPTGLYASYYAGLRGLRTKIIDSLPELGGQLVTLYPEKYIYDVAGFPKIIAKDLANNLITQGIEYNPTVCLGERILFCERISEKGHSILRIRSDEGQEHYTKTLLLTAGIGAFTSRKLALPGIERFEGEGLLYSVKELRPLKEKQVLIVGGGDSAVDWALSLSEYAGRVILIHRRGEFRAHEDNVRKLMASKVEVKLSCELKEVHGQRSLERADILHTATMKHESIPVNFIILALGFHTSPGPLNEWGLDLENHDIKVNSRMESNVPGIYAAGDIASFPGKLKLIATGFGEAAIAVNTIKSRLDAKANYFPGHSSDLEPPPNALSS